MPLHCYFPQRGSARYRGGKKTQCELEESCSVLAVLRCAVFRERLQLLKSRAVPQRGWCYAAAAHSVAYSSLFFLAFADILDVLVNYDLLEHI